jgi:hypothetical protein
MALPDSQAHAPWGVHEINQAVRSDWVVLSVCELAPRIGAGVVKRTVVINASDDGRPYAGPQLTNAAASGAECPIWIATSTR